MKRRRPATNKREEKGIEKKRETEEEKKPGPVRRGGGGGGIQLRERKEEKKEAKQEDGDVSGSEIEESEKEKEKEEEEEWSEQSEEEEKKQQKKRGRKPNNSNSNSKHIQFSSSSSSSSSSSKQPANQIASPVLVQDQEEFICPICCEIMKPPIVMCKIGHTICSKCHDNPMLTTCPMCRVPLDKAHPIRNFPLEKLGEKRLFKCAHPACNQCFPLSKYHPHVAICPHRPLTCAHPKPCANLFYSVEEWVRHHAEKHGKQARIPEPDGSLTELLSGKGRTKGEGSRWYDIIRWNNSVFLFESRNEVRDYQEMRLFQVFIGQPPARVRYAIGVGCPRAARAHSYEAVARSFRDFPLGNGTDALIVPLSMLQFYADSATEHSVTVTFFGEVA